MTSGTLSAYNFHPVISDYEGRKGRILEAYLRNRYGLCVHGHKYGIGPLYSLIRKISILISIPGAHIASGLCIIPIAKSLRKICYCFNPFSL